MNKQFSCSIRCEDVDLVTLSYGGWILIASITYHPGNPFLNSFFCQNGVTSEPIVEVLKQMLIVWPKCSI